MSDVTLEAVVELADRLRPDEQQALIRHLQQLSVQLITPEEFKRSFESLSVDLGPISGDFSFRREDWYGDGER